MKYFKITYSCGCGEHEEYIEASDIVEASDAAYQNAKEEYTSYERYNGIRSFAEIAKEDFGIDLSEEIEDEELLAEIDEAYAMEIENTISYSAIEVPYVEYTNGGIKEMRYFKVSELELRDYLLAVNKLACLERDGVDDWEWYMASRKEFIAECLGKTVEEVEENDLDFEDVVDLDIQSFQEIG